MATGRTQAETDELELGKRLAECLPAKRSQLEVAKMLGVTRQAVRRTERRALAKVAKLLREAMSAGAFEVNTPVGRHFPKVAGRRWGGAL